MTHPKQWENWEKDERYCRVLTLIFKRLADFVSLGYLHSYFVNEINLLEGFSDCFLRQVETKLEDFIKFLARPRCVKCFHSKIKSIYCGGTNKEINLEKSQGVELKLEKKVEGLQASDTVPSKRRKSLMNDDQKLGSRLSFDDELRNLIIEDLEKPWTEEELNHSLTDEKLNEEGSVDSIKKACQLNSKETQDATRSISETFMHVHRYHAFLENQEFLKR